MDSTQKAEMQGGPKLYPFTPTLFEKLINPHGQGALFMFILVNDSSASIPHAQIHGDDRGHGHLLQITQNACLIPTRLKL